MRRCRVPRAFSQRPEPPLLGVAATSLEEVDGINDKLKEIIYQTQKSVDEDELTFKQSIAKSKECYVLLRVVRKIAKKKDKCEKQAIDNEFAIELDKDELKLFKGLFAEMFK